MKGVQWGAMSSSFTKEEQQTRGRSQSKERNRGKHCAADTVEAN